MAVFNVTTHAQTDNNSLLWRISGKGISKPSYLFGTMHLICRSDYLWTAAMQQSLDKSEKVCFEMDLDDQNTIMQSAAGLMDNTGKKLSDYFTTEQYAKLKKYVHDTVGIDIALMENLKPVALQTLLGSQSPFCNDPVSYEDSIMRLAQNQDKEILGLEAPKEQLDALASIPIDTVIKELMSAIDDNAADDGEYKALVDAYKSQNLDALHSQMVNSQELQAQLGVFLDDRNKRWIPRMSGQMKNTSIFFAVGAGHLWGDNGVISLLRKNGYKVEPLKN